MIEFRSLHGLTDYKDAQALQLELVEKRIRDEIADTVLLLEHNPVITRGRGLQRPKQSHNSAHKRHMPLPPLPPELPLIETERGGDLTYHGPGQLVVYPIFKLNGDHALVPKHDLEKFIRGFENVTISVLEHYGLKGYSVSDATGVWVEDRKIASMGIAIRKWVTYHGLAINVINDLAPFQFISPCGFSPDVMTRISDLTQTDPNRWRAKIEAQFFVEIHKAADFKPSRLARPMAQPSRQAARTIK